MSVKLTLAVRSWAVLDAALEFFRAAPEEIVAAQHLARNCRKLHQVVRRAGIQYRYIPVGVLARGRSLLRLRLKLQKGPREALALGLSPGLARTIGQACLMIIRVQTDLEGGALLDHEAEELQAARAYLSELRRQGILVNLPDGPGPRHLRWDNDHREYNFSDRVAARVRQYYLLAGASLN